jgi:hypothetical protein
MPRTVAVQAIGLGYIQQGMDGYEVGSGHGGHEVGHEECGKCDVKWQKWLSTMCHVEGGVAGGFVNGSTVSPEDKRSETRPLGDVAFACFDEGLANSAVLTLDDAISSRVIR